MKNNENNIQNQESKKKETKGVSVPLVIIILIAVLIIGIGGGYLLSKNNELFNKNTNTENKTTEQNKTSKKIDESKDWVYDAEYGNNKPVKTINSWNGNEVLSSKKELVVPYININSTAGKNANKEIEKLYEEMYNIYATDENLDVKTMSRLEYKYYINNNILSVVIESSTYAVPGGAGRCPLDVYNFNLDTLENATNEELAKQTGYNSIAEVNEIVNKWIIKEKTDEEIEGTAGSIMGLVNDTYFIDSNNKLNFVYTVAAAGTYDYTKTVDEIKDTQINDNNNKENQSISVIPTGLYQYKQKIEKEDFTIRYSLYLYDNGTFKYEHSIAAPTGAIGKYSIKDNNLILNVQYLTGSNTGMTKTNETITLKINNNTIIDQNGYYKGLSKKYSNIDFNNITMLKANENDDKEYLKAYPSIENIINNAVITDINGTEINSTDNNQYSTAVSEIKKYLKDEEWIKENILIRDYEDNILENQKMTFICLKKENNNTPMLIVQSYCEKYTYSEAILITYNNGQIKTQKIFSGSTKIIQVDPNNKIITAIDSESGQERFSKIENGVDKSIEWVSAIDTDDKNIEYYYGTGNGDNAEISKEEYENILKKYKQYNFVSIETELTNENIDVYIK